MFLKSLVLRGFKTFADKTVFEFEPNGLTAIVGPNGCGKSNTVDAFRFILGEGSLSEIRVKELSDIIFAGTQTKKPLSMGEVAITFDNSDHALPIDFSEVSIRRRTFRDGASDFLINNNSCRLKDIRDLFLDAGISEDSLSIIGQGKVDSILSSQPEERRQVFEEVAGIKKYKQRKEEAEKKLILAEQNLLRICDLKNEIGENLSVLEEQSKAAEEYLALKESFRSLEIGISKKQVAVLLEKSGLLKEEIERFEKSEDERLKKEKIVGAEKHSLKEKIKTLDLELENARIKLETLREKAETERFAAMMEKENRLRDLKEAERFLAFEIGQLKNTNGTIDAKLLELRKKTERAGVEAMDILPELKEFVALSEKLFSISRSLIKGLHQKEIEDHSKSSRLLDILNAEIVEFTEQKQNNENALRQKEAEMKAAAEKLNAEQPSPPLVNLAIQEEQAKLQEKIVELKKEKEQCADNIEFLESRGETPEEAAAREFHLKNKLLLAKTEGELSQVTERIFAEYNLTVSDLMQIETEIPNVGAAKKETLRLKSRMLELEPVNLIAIEEYKQSTGRFRLINEQYEDLNSARENLKGLIAELDLKAREEFLRKMEIISAHFKQIFTELFPGGEAKIELALSENSNPLEAGIEISTCPGGRKWLPLQALSGGERALTAIAILFAFLKTNPSPFCILDEVDAPLDDANIDRFTKYLKEMAKVTQMMIITHNKHTMKAADTIYGITMEEAGVSKLLSMKMNKLAAETVA
ncbi:hypothetical protein A2276_01600 [candidate division WOR-1 bacterium RIFOXYA12_FULL_43_27]|uniref:RecF/RecN/SMC N-terminal domain-containing protein n=1 Tax=candidate division WOR-1 bacterium RIFOXYC2_FULL_46_14 TaxID=1802587 RepID=A0A1F4U6P5_UNCSA|nr:MAG: hypothetical protein A2276_01600 [candidate division WOR-1 bacterium RIFOXYA12_FULL_43_27]OGC19579.1 MAG: hypothetical protein A2292_02730 [candidate division WOR-1 bacterium RIFOXYB2_FULL_46_45]OGC30568.1 MAG: hypothetical protein A2232_02730 [candidate division WOR-1 bacterium RIFOXYA2_FULL_46_56]OGC40635.1 MAG: hypothetical protein A2438_06445 [candidate division WOR-1 bacterium RIFOXYC2_FULL_46_14]